MTAAQGPVWVGVDVGTQSLRVLAVAGTGRICGRGSAPLSSRRRGGTHEQDPGQWWHALGAAARQAVSGLGNTAVAGIAVAATSGTVLLVDRSGRALTPGLMYDDLRARPQALAANTAGAALWRRLGYQRMQPSWGLPKLLWLIEHHPDQVAAGAQLAHQSDYLNRRLAGQPVAADLSNALKTGCDLIRGSWPQQVMQQLGVPPHMLPPLVSPGACIGTLSRAAADHTGLPPGTPIVAGATDGYAAQLAAGVVDVGDWNCVLGTTLVLKGVADRLVADPSGSVYCHRSPDGLWLPGGASSCGAGALTRLLPGRDPHRLAEAAAADTPTRMLTYPLASGQGERFPFVAPQARLFQLGTPSDDHEVYASLMQAIAMIERLCFDHLNLIGAPLHGRRVLTGAAAASPYVCQLHADITGRPVVVTESAEPAAGMAVLAAAGEHGLSATSRAMVHVSKVHQPRPDVTGRFAAAYLRLVRALRDRAWLPGPLAEHAHKRTTT